jgi:hypothetical protein
VCHIEAHREVERQGTNWAEANIDVPHRPAVEGTTMVGFAFFYKVEKVMRKDKTQLS